MKIYAISDTHFNHKKLIEWGRPADFEAQILANLAKENGDLLIHCGDFSIGKDEESVKAYMGATIGFKKRILVRGNHDSHSNNWWTERGFDFVCDSFSARYFGKHLLFTHAPEPRGNYDLNIHGHMHGNAHRLEGEIGTFYDPTYHKDLAPEINNYAPVNIERFITP